MQKSSQKNKIEHDSKTYCVNIYLDALFPRQDVLSMLANQKSTTEDMLTVSLCDSNGFIFHCQVVRLIHPPY